MTTKSAHEKKMDELRHLLTERLAEEMKTPRLGCFGTLLCTVESNICKECLGFPDCQAELEKTRKTQVVDLDTRCKQAGSRTKKKKPAPAPEPPAPEPEKEPSPELEKEVAATPRRGTVDWAAAVGEVINQRPANYSDMTTILINLLTDWGGLDTHRYRKYKEIAYRLRDKGLVSFEDHKTDNFTWL